MSRVKERANFGGKTVKVLDTLELHKAHVAGVSAKRRGWARIAPYYDIPPLEHFWLAGYDGKGFKEAAAEGQ